MPQTSSPEDRPESGPLQARLRDLLQDLARRRACVTYLELATLAEVPAPHRIHTLTLALEALIREDAAAGRPLLAARAVSRGANGVPGRGFFQLLRELGLYRGEDSGAEAAARHAAELERVWRHWEKPAD